ncbi:Nuclear actin-protein involved in chromatin remodeling [Entomophthora muscae]|uniref:Nuclear actin-protein involved in chromatin remodeling n=1 Tax=Entomophthora muscae TaxID=34485 RepID=A0ACC2TNV5_9FUNG|nr:Nuclear actin-protein involved in chromatin remodeling [Entomophthora muscae]
MKVEGQKVEILIYSDSSASDENCFTCETPGVGSGSIMGTFVPLAFNSDGNSNFRYRGGMLRKLCLPFKYRSQSFCAASVTLSRFIIPRSYIQLNILGKIWCKFFLLALLAADRITLSRNSSLSSNSPPDPTQTVVDAFDAPLLPPLPHPYSDYQRKFYNTDAALVIDFGSSHCRAGWSTEAEPRVVFDSIVAKYRERASKGGCGWQGQHPRRKLVPFQYNRQSQHQNPL